MAVHPPAQPKPGRQASHRVSRQILRRHHTKSKLHPCCVRRGRPSISPCTNSGTPSKAWGSRCSRRWAVRSAVLPCATNPMPMAKRASWAHQVGAQRNRPHGPPARKVHGCRDSPESCRLRCARRAQTAQSQHMAKPSPNNAHMAAARGRLGHADSRATPSTHATTAVTPLATHRCASSETCFTRSM